MRKQIASLSHTWGTEPHERAWTFPCDGIIPSPDDALYRGISIRARPADIFRWLCQLRIAPYSYDWIDNLGRQSPRHLVPDMDELAIGQKVMEIFELADFARDQHLTLRIKPGTLAQRAFGNIAVSYLILAEGDGSCRLLIKMAVCYPPRILGSLMRVFMPWGDLIMMRRQLLNFKYLAEKTASEV